jgi:hypothetical protein
MADFTAYRTIARQTSSLFSGVIPAEIACGSFHITPSLDRKTLLESLVSVAHVKKCDHYEGRKGEPSFIASFIVSFGSVYSLAEIREALVETYTTQDVEHDFETDLLAVLGKGLIVKKWGESRSYAAIETGEDTLTWFYILMSEYLDSEKGCSPDLRSFVLDQKEYTEY